MNTFRVLITDLTDYGDLRCVAGWDLDRQLMIRPEPHPGGFWDQSLCGPNKPYNPGNIVQFQAALPNPPTEYPHLNEDRVVAGKPLLEKTLSRADFASNLRKVRLVDRAVAFTAPVEISNSKAYIKVGTNHPSLQGLEIRGDQISFFEDSFMNGPKKPRCLLEVPNRPSISLSLTATDVHQLYKKQGINGLKDLYVGNYDLHVRLGLARGFGTYPDRCYMQINGIYRL